MSPSYSHCQQRIYDFNTQQCRPPRHISGPIRFSVDIYSLFVTSLVSAGCEGEGCREGQSEARSGGERGIIYIDHRTKIYDYKQRLYSMASNGDDLWKCRK